MNKGITFLILLVVVTAMGLVMYSHIDTKEDALSSKGAPVVASGNGLENRGINNGYNNPTLSPQGSSSTLRSFETPLPTPSRNNASGPKAVRVTTGTDGKPVVPVQTPLPTPPVISTEPEKKNDKPTVAEPVSKPVETPPASKPTPAPDASAPVLPVKDQSPTQELASLAASNIGNNPENTKAPVVVPPVPKTKTSSAPGLEPWSTPPQSDSGSRAEAVALKKPVATSANAGKISETGAHSLHSIALNSTGQNIMLDIAADTPFPCKTFVLTGPDRLVIDLPGTWKGMRAPSVPENDLVKKIRLGQQASGPRLVLDLSGPMKGHRVERSGNTVQIVVQ